MDFKGKSFKYVEFVKKFEGNRGTFVEIKEVESYIWRKENLNKKEEIWKSIYSYFDINNREYSYAPFYFESDIPNFDLNRKVILFLVDYLMNEYDIPLEAFKFKLTNRSIWVEVVPQIFGIKPCKHLNKVYKLMARDFNDVIKKRFNISNALDLNVYNERQLTRISGSYLKRTKRYVIELKYIELVNYEYKHLINLAKNRRKYTYLPNNEFIERDNAKLLFQKYKNKVNNIKSEIETIEFKELRPCIKKLEKEGVEEGYRNNAIFYAAINMREMGMSKDEIYNRIMEFISNFDKTNIDSISKIKATINSAIKKRYKFSCKNMKLNFEDVCDKCETCKYNIKQSNNIIVYKNQLDILIKNNVSKTVILGFYKYLLDIKNENKTSIDRRIIYKLRELEILKNNTLNKELMVGPYIKFNKETINSICNLGAEVILYTQLLISSYNNEFINPQLDLKSYSIKMNKSLRSIQRMFKDIKDKGLIDNSKFIYSNNKELNNIIKLIPMNDKLDKKSINL